MVLIEDEFVGVDFFANSTAHIVLVGDLIRQVEQHKSARSAALGLPGDLLFGGIFFSGSDECRLRTGL